MQALQELGVNGAILTVKTGGKSFLEATARNRTLGAGKLFFFWILTGEAKKEQRLQGGFGAAKIKANMGFWRELRAFVGREIRCIESLPSYLSTLQEKAM